MSAQAPWVIMKRTCSFPHAARAALCSSLTFALLACSSSATTAASGTDAGDATDASADAGGPPAYPSSHAAMPSVVDLGGPVLAAPVIIPVTFDADPLQADIDTFVAAFDKTTYWGDVTREYGAAPAKAGKPVHLGDMPGATIDDAAIQTFLADRLDGTHPEWPAAGPNNLYVLFYPPGTSVTMMGETSCSAFHGYHFEAPLKNNGKAVYAVVSRCSTLPELPGVSGVDYVSAVSSHEIVEAITDPYPESAPAYASTDDDHIAWSFLGLAELGDMCALIGGAFYTPPDFPYPVQRIWSNAIAKASSGHDPCVPAVKGQPYFNAAPLLTDTVSYNVQGQGGKTRGVQIPVGQKKTIELDLFSDTPMSAPFTVSVTGPPSAKFSLDRTSGQNGDKLALTITAVSANKDYGATPFIVKSTQGSATNIWVGLVGN